MGVFMLPVPIFPYEAVSGLDAASHFTHPLRHQDDRMGLRLLAVFVDVHTPIITRSQPLASMAAIMNWKMMRGVVPSPIPSAVRSAGWRKPYIVGETPLWAQ